MGELDAVRLRLEGGELLLLNAILGLVMFGVALDLSPQDFKRAAKEPRGPLVGVVAQFVLLPWSTLLLTLALRLPPSVALGMLVVACCPGGNVSNVLTHLARGRTALSITMTAISTAAAVVLTPLNLAWIARLHPDTAGLLREVSLDPLEVLGTVLLILGLPLALGMAAAARFPDLARRARGPFRVVAILCFVGFVVVGLAKNLDHVRDHVGSLAAAVAVHNAAALALGWLAARALGLAAPDRRAVSIEVGTQNSALALVLVLGFFPDLGGAAVVCAWWGVWHLVSGLGLALVWGRRG